jgi:BirA family biotin operon repressor/biotin-[acetyl-CoA-carboxylase] ligase
VVAASQSEGRGRRGRTWADHPGASLLCSVVLRTELPVALVGLIPIAAGVAAGAAVESAAGVRPELKWPNDVLIAGRKVGGILVETHAASGSVVIGLGMNIGREAVPPDLADVATSLETEADAMVAPSGVLAGFLNALESLVNGLAVDNGVRVRREWEARMAWRGMTVTVSPAGDGGPAVSGVALGLADDGSLRLATTTGVTAVYAGDVSLSGPAAGARAPA